MVLPGTPPGAYRLKVATTLAGLEAHDANGNPLGRELELAGDDSSDVRAGWRVMA